MKSPDLRSTIAEDINCRRKDKKHSWRTFVRVLLDPSFLCIFLIRLRLYFAQSSSAIFFLPKIATAYLLLILFSTQVSGRATIGQRLRIAHPIGIVIGKGSRIGDDCTIFQRVTLGSKGDAKKAYPTLGDEVTLYANVCIIGDAVLGDRVVVGANAVVLCSFPEDTCVGGIPAKVLSSKSKTKIKSEQHA